MKSKTISGMDGIILAAVLQAFAGATATGGGQGAMITDLNADGNLDLIIK